MSDYKNIWVMSENVQDYPALCKCAVSVAAGTEVKITALWMGAAEDAAELQSLGVSAVCLVPKDEQVFVGSYGSALTEALKNDACNVFLCATSKNSRLLAAQVAAGLKTGVVNDVTALSCEGGELVFEHMVYGGSAVRKERVANTPTVALLSESLLLGYALDETIVCDTAGTSEKVELSLSPTEGISLLGVGVREVETVNLAGASIVVSVGRGFEKEEDLQYAKDLAAALNGEVGCTRPIAEGSGWMSHERYIGVSGAMLKPNIFIAIGLSGQIQHMVGANRAKTIVAINTDKNAAIFKQADYGLIGDLTEVVPKLTAALK